MDYIETQAAKDYATNIGLFADSGCDIVVTVGFALGEATGIAAGEYPDVDFIGVDQWQGEAIANVAGLLFPEDQAGYLAGALAASLSTSGVIAEVLGTDLVPPVVAFGEGFVNGAKHIDPSITVIKTYHPGGLDVAFTDPEWGATTARQALDQGADVVFGAGGKTGNGAIIEVAGEAGAFCIGVDTDQWTTVPEAHPCLVSSSMKMIVDGVSDLIGQSLAGSMPAGNYYGGVALAPFHDHADSVPAEVQDMLVALKADLESGAIPTCVWVTDAPGCEAPAETSDTKAAFIYVGPTGDAGWTWAHDQGRQYAEAETGVETAFVESVPEGTADFGNYARQFIEDGFNVIVGTSFGYMDDMLALADEYPDVVFEHVSGYKANDTNFGNTFGRMYEPRYLSGMVAGSATTSNLIGYVAAFPIPEVIRGINAFALGVQETNPDAVVEVAWTSTWFDPVVEGDSAQALLDKGADVIAMHQDSTAAGDKAEAAGARWVSYNSDMSAFAPNAFLTAPVWNWGPRYVDIIESAAAGTYTPGYYWGSMADGIVDLAPIADDVDADVVAAVEARKAEIIAGTFHPFSGPINDQAGNVMVAAGETMDDGSMLGMGLFVEGVVGATGNEPDDFWPEPVVGGTLRIGLEAETDGLNPAVNRFAVSAYQMGTAVYDYLVVTSDDPCGCVYIPSLAESWTHSDDYATWDFKIREGVTFHDGSPLTAEAVLYALKMQLNDPTVGIAVRALFAADDPETEAFEPAELLDEMTIRYHAKRPHVDFPGNFTGQLGNVPSLAYMMAATDDPTLNQAPVGTGPFMFDSRVQDSMTRFVRNPDYWGDTAYLDAVEFYIYTDGELAAGAMAAGDIDVMGTSNTNAILTLRALDGIELYETDDYEESFAMANSSRPPFDDIRARKALTYAFPRDDYVEFIGAGVLRAADQASTPESPFYNPDVVQEHDTPDLATPLVAEYCADVPEMCTDGRINAEYQYSGPSVIQDQIFDLLTEGWSDHFNFTKDLLPQDDHITHAILGMWDFLTWRQFGSINPDGHILWTECQSVGALSLNWPRYCDEERDALMFEARASDDREANVELWKQWAVSINESYTYLFQTHTMWTNAYDTKVKNVCGYVLPDGSTPLCHVNSANPSWAHMWIEE